MSQLVGVIGSSARAAVHSLARAGFSAWAVDQFNDRDLKRVAVCALCPSDGYPAALPELTARFPPGPFIYTGGLENHPHIVAELSRSRELWGNPPEVLARVRDPFALFHAQAASGFAVPRLVPQGEPCPREGRWLRKPLRSGGGIGIRFARPDEPASSEHYFQEWIDGVPMSALYGGTTLLGVTEQLIGESWLHAASFAYCGNIGPVVPPIAFPQFVNLGRCLVSSADLREQWGVDFVQRDDAPYPLEVNPRCTASLEVLEHSTGCSVFQQWLLDHERAVQQVVGKAIYYAPHAITFPQSGPWDADLAGAFDPWRLPTFADIPDAKSAIQAGWPVLTFFATGSTPAEVRERLQSRAAELDRLFAEHSP